MAKRGQGSIEFHASFLFKICNKRLTNLRDLMETPGKLHIFFLVPHSTLPRHIRLKLRCCQYIINNDPQNIVTSIFTLFDIFQRQFMNDRHVNSGQLNN